MSFFSMASEKLLDNFSTHLKNTIARSISIAVRFGYSEVTPAHLLYALREEEGSIGAEILTRVRVTAKDIIPYLPSGENTPPMPLSPPPGTPIPELNEAAKQVLEKAMITAYERGHSYIGTEHLLSGLIQSEDNFLRKLFLTLSIDKTTVEDEIEVIFQSTSRFPDVEDVEEMMEHIQEQVESHEHEDTHLPKASRQPQKRTKTKRGTNAIDVFTVDLTSQKLQRTIDPVIGREREIERVIHILSRRTKNNPVLIGEPGVGKTAIVEGLAKRIVEGRVPDVLQRKKIVALDLTLLIAGTIYRGEFEARLKQLIDEVGQQRDIILFIDEIHTIIGAGSNQGTMDAANILKPALARGALHCIGATTLDEYTKYMTSDPALERRFQPVMIGEPNNEDTVAILKGVKRYYEDFHGTTFTPDALEAAVELSTKYIHDNFLPDKAIDLIDEAAAAVRTSQEASPLEKRYRRLIDEIDECKKKKTSAIQQERLEEAMRYKEKEKELQKQVILLEKEAQQHSTLARKKVTRQHIVRVLASRLNLPESHLFMNDLERVKRLGAELQSRIVGQDHVIEQVVQTLTQASLGLRDPKKPLASFLFAGPSGVGKTILAKTLAAALYQDEHALIQFDMSEFVEAHSVSKLLGSPAGYVGHKERNRFTDDIRKRPTAIILFDEFDQAHPDVQKLLLQILEEGELTDSQGKKTSFRHAIIILTATIEPSLYTGGTLGFGTVDERRNVTERVTQKLKEMFGNSIVSRIRSVCPFLPLEQHHVEDIIRRRLKNISEHLAIKNPITITPDRQVISTLAQTIYQKDTGVRHLEHMLERVMHEPLVEILEKRRHKKTYTLTKRADRYHLV